MLGRKRQRAPLFISIQTRPAEAVGAHSFAFSTPYFTPVPLLGSGVAAGSYGAESGRQLVQMQNGTEQGYGGLFSGVYAAQNLVKKDYVTGLLE